jgi:hypothetical protein
LTFTFLLHWIIGFDLIALHCSLIYRQGDQIGRIFVIVYFGKFFW